MLVALAKRLRIDWKRQRKLTGLELHGDGCIPGVQSHVHPGIAQRTVRAAVDGVLLDEIVCPIADRTSTQELDLVDDRFRKPLTVRSAPLIRTRIDEIDPHRNGKDR